MVKVGLKNWGLTGRALQGQSQQQGLYARSPQAPSFLSARDYDNGPQLSNPVHGEGETGGGGLARGVQESKVGP